MNTEDYKNPDGSIVTIYKGESVNIEDNVTLGNHVTLDAGVTIEKNSVIGNYCKLGKYVTIGKNCQIKDFCFIDYNTNIFNNVKIGKYCRIGIEAIIDNNTIIDSYLQMSSGIFIAKRSRISADYYIDGKTSEYPWCAHKNKNTGVITFTFGCETHPLSYWTYNNTMKLLKEHNFNHKDQVLKVRRAIMAYFKE